MLMFLGPPWVPLIGNGPELRKLAKIFGGQHLAYAELARRFDTEVIGLKIGKEKAICVCSYATVHHVLTSDEFLGRPDNFFFRLRGLGTRKGKYSISFCFLIACRYITGKCHICM